MRPVKLGFLVVAARTDVLRAALKAVVFNHGAADRIDVPGHTASAAEADCSCRVSRIKLKGVASDASGGNIAGHANATGNRDIHVMLKAVVLNRVLLHIGLRCHCVIAPVIEINRTTVAIYIKRDIKIAIAHGEVVADHLDGLVVGRCIGANPQPCNGYIARLYKNATVAKAIRGVGGHSRSRFSITGYCTAICFHALNGEIVFVDEKAELITGRLNCCTICRRFTVRARIYMNRVADCGCVNGVLNGAVVAAAAGAVAWVDDQRGGGAGAAKECKRHK